MSSKIIRAASPEAPRVSPFRLQAEGSGRGAPGLPDSPVPLDLMATEEPYNRRPERLAADAAIPLRTVENEKAAYERGLADGQKAGIEIGEKAVEPALQQYAECLDQLRRLRKDVLAASEREVIRLALEIARKIVRREIAIDEELVLTLVKVALKRVEDQSLLTIRVNPRDHGIIRRYQPSGADNASFGEGIRLVEDALISRGGCVIETENGLVDARIEEQFREIEKGFFE
jgi:flagellar assembly protein FliH